MQVKHLRIELFIVYGHRFYTTSGIMLYYRPYIQVISHLLEFTEYGLCDMCLRYYLNGFLKLDISESTDEDETHSFCSLESNDHHHHQHRRPAANDWSCVWQFEYSSCTRQLCETIARQLLVHMKQLYHYI